MKEQARSRSIHALVVEDQPADAELLLYNIRKAGFDLTADVVAAPEELRRHLLEGQYDVVFSDFNLRDWTAFEALEIFKASQQSIPFIVVSGTIGDVQAVECIKRGATDYVLKHDMAPRLVIAIERALSDFAAARVKNETESALRASKVALIGAEDRFEKIFQLSPDATAITVLATGMFVDVNEAYVRLSGYARAELIGKTAVEVGLWPTVEMRNKVIDKLKRDNRVRHEEVEFRIKDGRLRLTLYSAELIRFGNEAYVLAVIRDITDRRAIESKLRLSSKILNAIANLVLVADGLGNIVYASPSVKTVLGYEPKDVLDNQWWELVSADGKTKPAKDTIVGIAQGNLTLEAMPLDQLITHRDGSLRCILWQHSQSDDLTIMVGQDITALKETEQALRISQDRYRLLFDSNPQPMYVYDSETLEFLDVNESAIKKYGYPRQDFLSATIRQIEPLEHGPQLLASPESSKSGAIQDGPHIRKQQTRSGELMEMEIAAHDIMLSGKQAVLVLAKDVTEERRLERRLQQSQKMEAIGQLAGGIAHDFNNLLGIIMGQAELLTTKLTKPALRSRAESIVKAADRGASLTNQLLAFGRKQVFTTMALDLNALVRESVKLLERTLGEDIALKCNLDNALWPTDLDPGQIQELILNLAINSRDAMPNGGRLTIATFNITSDDMHLHGVEGESGDFVCMTVADNGIGMTEEVRIRIFEPFFTTKPAGKGTGLGLAMVYGIVKQSGGQIWVYSEVGQGTVFKLYFPRSASAVKVEETRLTPVAYGTETVLVVEDQEGFREVMVDVLKDYGYTVVEASNGKDALAKIANYKERIHLVISDVIMPEMSGAQLAAELQRLLPGTKVLFVSGYTGDAMYRQGGFTEDAEFLQKPFAPSALARKVRAILDKSSNRSANEEIH
jgi:PAS domain S-box-containing protein